MEERKALEKIALITASPVRAAIVSKLGIEAPMAYGRLKSSVEKSLERDVSDGSFAWHLEKLKGSRVITKISAEGLSSMTFRLKRLKHSSKESKEEEEAKEKFPKKVSQDLEIGRYRIEGYLLTKEGSEIKDAVRAAINKLKPPS